MNTNPKNITEFRIKETMRNTSEQKAPRKQKTRNKHSYSLDRKVKFESRQQKKPQKNAIEMLMGCCCKRRCPEDKLASLESHNIIYQNENNSVYSDIIDPVRLNISECSYLSKSFRDKLVSKHMEQPVTRHRKGNNIFRNAVTTDPNHFNFSESYGVGPKQTTNSFKLLRDSNIQLNKPYMKFHQKQNKLVQFPYRSNKDTKNVFGNISYSNHIKNSPRFYIARNRFLRRHNNAEEHHRNYHQNEGYVPYATKLNQSPESNVQQKDSNSKEEAINDLLQEENKKDSSRRSKHRSNTIANGTTHRNSQSKLHLNTISTKNIVTTVNKKKVYKVRNGVFKFRNDTTNENSKEEQTEGTDKEHCEMKKYDEQKELMDSQKSIKEKKTEKENVNKFISNSTALYDDLTHSQSSSSSNMMVDIQEINKKDMKKEPHVRMNIDFFNVRDDINVSITKDNDAKKNDECAKKETEPAAVREIIKVYQEKMCQTSDMFMKRKVPKMKRRLRKIIRRRRKVGYRKRPRIVGKNNVKRRFQNRRIVGKLKKRTNTLKSKKGLNRLVPRKIKTTLNSKKNILKKQTKRASILERKNKAVVGLQKMRGKSDPSKKMVVVNATNKKKINKVKKTKSINSEKMKRNNSNVSSNNEKFISYRIEHFPYTAKRNLIPNKKQKELAGEILYNEVKRTLKQINRGFKTCSFKKEKDNSESKNLRKCKSCYQKPVSFHKAKSTGFRDIVEGLIEYQESVEKEREAKKNAQRNDIQTEIYKVMNGSRKYEGMDLQSEIRQAQALERMRTNKNTEINKKRDDVGKVNTEATEHFIKCCMSEPSCEIEESPSDNENESDDICESLDSEYAIQKRKEYLKKVASSTSIIITDTNTNQIRRYHAVPYGENLVEYKMNKNKSCSIDLNKRKTADAKIKKNFVNLGCKGNVLNKDTASENSFSMNHLKNDENQENEKISKINSDSVASRKEYFNSLFSNKAKSLTRHSNVENGSGSQTKGNDEDIERVSKSVDVASNCGSNVDPIKIHSFRKCTKTTSEHIQLDHSSLMSDEKEEINNSGRNKSEAQN